MWELGGSVFGIFSLKNDQRNQRGSLDYQDGDHWSDIMRADLTKALNSDEGENGSTS